MSLSAICHRGAQVLALCGLLLALSIVAGCGRKPATAALQQTKTEAPKTNVVAVAQTNLSNPYASVFENLLPPTGRDPFFPSSHRRDPKVEVADTNAPGPPVDAVLVLKAIIRTDKHSQAVINNEIFEEGEDQPVRIPSGHVGVRCIEIGTNSVLIQVDGEAEPKRLQMRTDNDDKKIDMP
jgi:hypothetical protein